MRKTQCSLLCAALLASGASDQQQQQQKQQCGFCGVVWLWIEGFQGRGDA
jgi:hypothetical protein